MAFPLNKIPEQVNLASKLITEADYCVALSGAGISTKSGIPDFRSSQSGLWTKYSPMEVASLSSFRYDPNRFYDWLSPFVKKVFQADPNPAHLVLAKLEEEDLLKCVVTQNIDALHQKAGSKNVIELHGTYLTLTCLGCYQQISADNDLLNWILEHAKAPACSHCGGVLKPDIILYEEQLPRDKWNLAKNEINQCDLLLILGSSLTVTPACDLPYLVLKKGGNVVIINQSHTHLDDIVSVSIQGDLAEILPKIQNKVLNELV
jgi:NAD-dependent deacetylase